MNFRLILNIMGYTLWVEAGCLLLPLLVSAGYGETCWEPFLWTLGLCSLCGLILTRIPARKNRLQGRDGYAVVAMAWIVLCLFGAVPYVLSGAVPHYADALFETASGLTTTGATILTDVEAMPRGILFWRALTQWMGGMGVLVLFLALMPRTGAGAVHLMRAESPGPIKSKLLPHVSDTAKVLYGIYIGLTAAEIVALCLAGMDFLRGCAPLLFHHLHRWLLHPQRQHCRLRLPGHHMDRGHLHVPVGHQLLFDLHLPAGTHPGGAAQRGAAAVYPADAGIHRPYRRQSHGAAERSAGSGAEGFRLQRRVHRDHHRLRHGGLCPVAGLWSDAAGDPHVHRAPAPGLPPAASRSPRILLLGKLLHREIKKILHPKHISVITVDGQLVEDRVISSAAAYMVAYMILLLGGATLLAWDNLGFTESFTAVLTCLGNVGPGLGRLGPAGNFSPFSGFSKVVMSLLMLLGAAGADAHSGDALPTDVAGAVIALPENLRIFQASILASKNSLPVTPAGCFPLKDG